jgi:hypothetical protein
MKTGPVISAVDLPQTLPLSVQNAKNTARRAHLIVSDWQYATIAALMRWCAPA